VAREKDDEGTEKPSDEEGEGGESTDFYSAPSRVVMLTDQEAGSDPESDPMSSVPAENLEMPDDGAPGLVSYTCFSLHLQIVKDSIIEGVLFILREPQILLLLSVSCAIRGGWEPFQER